MIRLLRQAWDRLSLYLPMFLMGVLALATYWLVRSTPLLEAPAPAPSAARHVPDYFMQKFSVKTFDVAGRLKSEIFGEQARHYPDTDTLEIDLVRIRSFNAQGQLTTATAKRALANSGATEVQLMGDALVVREAVVQGGETTPRLSFQGEFLHAYIDTERVKSHQPVLLTRGTDQFTADSLEYDNVDKVMQLRGRVKGVLLPANIN